MKEPLSLKTRFCSSLVKILQQHADFQSLPYDSAAALKGETFSFQLACFPNPRLDSVRIKAISSLKNIRIRSVESVPVRWLPPKLDDDVVTREPMLIPDLLRDLPDRGVALGARQWRGFWITVRIPEKARAGIFPIAFEITAATGQYRTPAFQLEILPARLPSQKLIRTEWFHCDCLATYYQVPVFSEEHWTIIEHFMKNAADHGCNMILTPIFTPPLDTDIGAERPTIQLVDVHVSETGKYTFGFERLARWLKLARSTGMKYIEISHLFTQWGAKATPKIIAEVNGEEKRLFGWDVRSTSRQYREFLTAFLPELCRFLKQAGLTEDQVYFHTSDEPKENDLRQYEKAARLLQRLTPGFLHLDAISEYSFYEKGLVETPVPFIEKLEEFLAKGMPVPWTYYCCFPYTGMTNCFIHFTSSRTRVLGMELFRYGVKGFLRWGFDFYYSMRSRFPIDPYQINDASYAFPPGDAFLVYPGKDGIPEDSLRNELIFDGLQDMRALELIEAKAGRTEALRLLDGITLKEYPRGEKAFLALRNAIDRKIRDLFLSQRHSYAK